MSQLPPGFVLDDPAPAPAKAGPIYGAPPKPEKPEQPKTTYRPMTADEVTAIIGPDMEESPIDEPLSSMQEEYDTLMEQGTWELVPRPTKR